MNPVTDSAISEKAPADIAPHFNLLKVVQEVGSASRIDFRSFALAFGDILAVVFSLILGWAASGTFRLVNVPGGKGFIPLANIDFHYVSIILVITTAILLTCNASAGHYSRGKLFWSQVTEQCKAVAYVVAVTTVALFATKEDFSRLWLVSFWMFMVLLLPLVRVFTIKTLIKRGLWFRKAVVIGDGQNARSAAAALEGDVALGYKVIGFVRKTHTALAGPNYVMRRVSASHLTSQLEEMPLIVFAYDRADEFTAHRSEIEELMTKTSNVVVAPPLAGLPTHEAEVLSIFKHDAVLLRLQNNLKKTWSLIFKRLFDLVVGSVVSILILPLALVITVSIYFSGGTPIFAHKRVGKNGRSFPCYKFRTMIPNADEKLARMLQDDPALRMEWEQNFKLKEDFRVTRIGKFLRSTSLDELPQLVNVLMGDMSLVGPRPIVEDEVERYGSDFQYFCSTKPGITGLWQISGRSNIDYDERIRLDKWYIRNWSIWQDIVILVKSIPIVLRKTGAY